MESERPPSDVILGVERENTEDEFDLGRKATLKLHENIKIHC